MNKLKKQFSDLRKSTPKHIQWLLLAAAFVVVLILITLLMTGREEEKLENTDDEKITLNVSPETIDWGAVIVGDGGETETIKISASAPVKILDIRMADNVPGFSYQNTCTALGQIDTSTSCSVRVTYNPPQPTDATASAIYIDWRGIDMPDAMKNTNKIVLVLGAKGLVLPEPEPLPEPTPVAPVDLEPVSEPENSDIAKPEPVKPTYQQEIKNDLDAIAPDDDFLFEDITTTTSITASDTPDYVRPPEACSDFAMPAYNLSGVQSGWIRPSGGAYYYHPFSDTECDNPTGTYNPDNGIITDIKNPGQKIGTDAEHIGYTTIQNGSLPQLSNPATTRTENRATQLTAAELNALQYPTGTTGKVARIALNPAPEPDIKIGTTGTAVFSSDPYDRKFVLRQYKPIPATIVSEVRADPQIYSQGQSLPVRATVDRNVYSDDGRTVVIPTGTLMLGYVTGDLPGPYQTIGRMEIKWYQFILPSGVEFNFTDKNAPFSGDSQGRAGVPGHGSTDYVEQLVMPMLTAIVPAAVNMIAPIADTFINQIDLDNNTVVQSGTVRSSELAKQEVISAWNQVAQKLLVDAMDNTVPPFSIAAGTRITVYSPMDLVITCGNDNSKECAVSKVQAASGFAADDKSRNIRYDDWVTQKPIIDYSDPSWVGQVRSFNLEQFCTNNTDDGLWDIDPTKTTAINESGYDYRTVLAYCQSMNYQAISNAQQDALYQNQQEQFKNSYNVTQSIGENNQLGGLTGISGNQAYNEEILGLTYDDSGAIQNPFVDAPATDAATTEAVITCEGGALPDEYGCCPGEIYTDMGEQGFNCCPEAGGDCFPPIL